MFQIFGDGSVAQYVLSKGELGSAHSIHWSWGVGVMMGVYASGGVSGKFMSKLTSKLTISSKYITRGYPLSIHQL